MERRPDGTFVSVEPVIRAPAPVLFAIVSDAARHPDVDCSGALIRAKAEVPRQLSLGATFGMSMQTPEGTKVTESWDIRHDTQAFLLKRGPVGSQAAEHMTASLERLAVPTEA
jgi:hypothetical protein